MTELKVEWAPVAFLDDHDPQAFPDDVPVVRLEAVDAVIREAVRIAERLVAMYRFARIDEDELEEDYDMVPIVKSFLASQVVAEWRKRKDGQS